MRQNLVPKVEMSGIYFPLWFGSGIHYALAQYYNPRLRRDPVEAFIWWYMLQLDGGIVTEEQLDVTHDRQPKKKEVTPQALNPEGQWDDAGESVEVYEVRGLIELLPDPNMEEFELHKELGIGMLSYYKEYAEANDNFAVIVEEHTFSVPIYGPDGNILEAIDPRDGRNKQVHLRGTQDAIIQDLENGQFGILEHKSAIAIGEEYHKKLEQDEQCTTYMVAGEIEAKLHDLEYEKIDFTLYNALRKAFPRPPTELKSGLFSTDRSKESTTIAMLDTFIEERGLRNLVNETPKMLEYYNYVRDIGEKQFIERTPVRRNRYEIAAAKKLIYLEALDMLQEPRIYPTKSGNWLCLNCPFRAPCLATDDGSDALMLLEDNYEPNWTR